MNGRTEEPAGSPTTRESGDLLEALRQDVPAQLAGAALDNISLARIGTAGVALGILFHEQDPDFWMALTERWAKLKGSNIDTWRQQAKQQSDYWVDWLTRADALPATPPPATLTPVQDDTEGA